MLRLCSWSLNFWMKEMISDFQFFIDSVQIPHTSCSYYSELFFFSCCHLVIVVAGNFSPI